MLIDIHLYMYMCIGESVCTCISEYMCRFDPQNSFKGREALFSAWWEQARRQLCNLIAWHVWPLLPRGLCLLCNGVYTGS